jgi:diacylglycerol kinase
MPNFLRSHHPARQAKSFKHAFRGIFHALLNEPNFRIQFLITTIAVILGKYFSISNVEWAILVLSLGLLLTAEMINTVVEEVIDNVIKEYHEGAKIIKDLSAGFVLITAITTLIILILIFGNRFF